MNLSTPEETNNAHELYITIHDMAYITQHLKAIFNRVGVNLPPVAIELTPVNKLPIHLETVLTDGHSILQGHYSDAHKLLNELEKLIV